MLSIRGANNPSPIMGGSLKANSKKIIKLTKVFQQQQFNFLHAKGGWGGESHKLFDHPKFRLTQPRLVVLGLELGNKYVAYVCV